MAQTGIDAMNPGDGDLSLGLPWLAARATDLQLPYVCANLVDSEGVAPFPGWKVVEAGNIKVGVFGITGNVDECDGCSITDATTAATGAVAALKEAGSQIIIGMVHMPDAEAKTLVEAVPGIDFIFSSHDRRRMEFPSIVGESPTYITRMGARGRQIGKLEIAFVEGGKGFYDPDLAGKAVSRKEQVQERITQLEGRLAEATTERDKTRYQRSLDRTREQLDGFAVADVLAEGRHTMTFGSIGLGKSVADDAAIQALVDEAKKILPEEPKRSARPQIGEFSGGSRCRSCHATVYKKWRSTKHAKAYNSLTTNRKHEDETCYACHVTGVFLEGGPRSPKEVSYLRNVQCEACHGASAKHVANAELPTALKGRESSTCVSCHNETSHGGDAPKFDPVAAMATIKCEDNAEDHANTGSRVELRRDGVISH